MAAAPSSSSARWGLQAQLEHLQSRHVGTGHADTPRHAWLVNQHRDALAAHVGHAAMLSAVAVAENESVARVRACMLDRMFRPCGPPPPDAALRVGDVDEADLAAPAAESQVVRKRRRPRAMGTIDGMT